MTEGELQTPVDRRAPRKGAVRPMTAADVPAVARLFLKIFRGADKPADSDLHDYLQALTLGSPSYNATTGTQVYQQQDGRIRSALLAVPMHFIACGNVVPGRLLGVFMTDANKEAAGAAQLILALRPKRADFSFCDSASPTSANHMSAIGGKPIPVQNLEWSRCFRPLGTLAGRFSLRFLRRNDPGLAMLVRPVDALLSRLRVGDDAQQPAGANVTDMSVSAFLAHAPRLIAHYAVRPLWSEDELGWLVVLAAQNTRLGAFTIRSVEDRAGGLIGAFVYYAAPGRTAHVLNILSLPGREIAVLGAMFRHLESTGHVEARGRAQPALMPGLALQRWLVFRHRAFAMALTRIPEVSDAVARGDIYIGGLAGEDWSRLMCDFR
ncbi:GNAT family N-acetyltransferase [Bradyrhizobium sp. CER78]|uniref:GNAT family N-acetyltransferase n=1 Tax=Bradyrhizobium sp. CER78 TaxID=3039162 RepID=UPI00244B28CB|nr:GNAT family N-acetyltransferase [Bradyrhizobium sp. CER78]MDH2380863.1 GNAT family N-acetyltransferase [Bradyrhizobium sp. CER78]